jgi:uncharacterized protein involved in exopolysaccharide biosynthesis
VSVTVLSRRRSQRRARFSFYLLDPRSGVSRNLLSRLLETFFRRWWLYLVPLVLLGIVGAMSVAKTKSAYKSFGTFNVETSTVLSNLSGNTDQGLTVQSPATETSNRLNSLLQTDQYIKDIVADAKLTEAVKSGALTLSDVRKSITTSPNGSNLVTVVAASRDPVVAQKLAAATIDAYVQSQIDTDASQSTAAVQFFDQLLKSDQVSLDQANQALTSYLAAHPSPVVGTRPDDEASEIARLNAAVTAAQNEYNNTLGKSQDAQLSTAQTKADVGQRLRVVDAPQVPLAPQAKLKKSILTFATFLILGLLLSGGAVVLATVLDHSLRSADDVEQRLGMRTLAVVPDVRLTFAGARASSVGEALRTKPDKRRTPSEPATRPAAKAPEPKRTPPKSSPPAARADGQVPAVGQPKPGAAPNNTAGGRMRRPTGTIRRPA